MKKLFLPVLCLLFAAGIGMTAPAVETWEQNSKVVYNDTLGVVTDSVFSDSVLVFGARAVILLVRGSATDSMAIPILQTKLPNGTWTYAGGTANWPPQPPNQTAPFTATTAVTSRTQMVMGLVNEGVTSGGTPPPIVNTYIRWRLKSSNARRYTGASNTGLSISGTYTITAIVLK